MKEKKTSFFPDTVDRVFILYSSKKHFRFLIDHSTGYPKDFDIESTERKFQVNFYIK